MYLSTTREYAFVIPVTTARKEDLFQWSHANAVDSGWKIIAVTAIQRKSKPFGR